MIENNLTTTNLPERITHPTTPLARRFLNKTQYGPETGCLNWTGAMTGAGYGSFRAAGKMWNAHKFSVELFVGPVEPGKVVRHTCDNPRCVNPHHLVIGTPAENSADWKERGQLTVPGFPLTEQEQDAALGFVEQRGFSQHHVGQLFGLKRATIGRAIRSARARRDANA